VMLKKQGFFISGIVCPFLGGLFCFWVGYEVTRQSPVSASAPAAVALVLGAPLVLVARLTTKGEFFARKPVAFRSSTERSQG
jgi:hypothetical protein